MKTVLRNVRQAWRPGISSVRRRRSPLPLGLRWPYRDQKRESTAEATRSAKNQTRLSRLEAVLVLAREPLGLRKLSQIANLSDGTEARTLIAELRSKYDKRGCAFQIEQVAGGYQLLTRPQFAHWLRPVVGVEEEIRLTPPALETLAVVAYRQPVLRAEVEAIRGVSCGEILRQLMDRGLLRIVGRSEELGRPLWYGTTKRFLEAFGLGQLDELPWSGQLRRRGAPDATEASSRRNAVPNANLG